MKNKPNKRRPGRPEGGDGTARGRILNAAEIVFSERGYARASFSEIAKRSKVTQAMVNYYFGSKEKLFKEVYLRRAREITQGRLDALRALEKRGKPITLAELISAYLDPAFVRRTRGGRAFLRLQWRLLQTEPPRFADKLRRQSYDELSRLYVAAIRAAAPHLSEKTGFWRLVFVIGLYAYVHSDTHRLEEISQGLCNSKDYDEMLSQTKAFVLGGMLAPNPAAS